MELCPIKKQLMVYNKGIYTHYTRLTTFNQQLTTKKNMLLQITTTHQPATDLGYLLHKRPGKFQTKKLSFGNAHVLYPEANTEKCTAALWIDINSVKLSKGRNQQFSKSFQLAQYVNDRPYVASSFMSTAIAKYYGSALNGNCKDRPELAKTAIPLEIKLVSVNVRGGESLIKDLFEPLGYKVESEGAPLNENFPDWGDSPYFKITLRGTLTVQEVLTHLYVLLPVLDNNKHYFVSEIEVEKLLAKGEKWLANHPKRNLIVARYLKYKTTYAKKAIDKMNPEIEEEEEKIITEKKITLHQQRLAQVAAELKASGAKSVADLGCGEGKLIKLLIPDTQFEKIIGTDVSAKSLEIAEKRLYLLNATPKKRARISLLHSSLMYRDERLSGMDAAALVEVIEHIEEEKLPLLERIVFGEMHPKTIIVTTPNSEYNALYEGLENGKMRHNDHRFEWNRTQFKNWAENLASKYNYTFKIKPIGEVDATHGASSQMAIFTKN